MKKIINIVEDEKDLNELVKSYLEKEGYIVNSYLTFDAAYSHIDDYCDLWILDIMLDDKSGFDLIEIIKNKNANIPVVFMSARDKEFDRIIGLDRLRAVHLNDSLNPLGSHKDRHARIGEGCIGLEALSAVTNHPKLRELPFILETPNDNDGYAQEIALLRNRFKE